MAGDKSLFSPLGIEKKGIQRPFREGKSKSTLEHLYMTYIETARELGLWVYKLLGELSSFHFEEGEIFL